MTGCLHCKLKETLADHLLEISKDTGGQVAIADVVSAVALVLGQLIASAETDRDRFVLLMVSSNVLKAAMGASVAEDSQKPEEKGTTRGLH